MKRKISFIMLCSMCMGIICGCNKYQSSSSSSSFSSCESVSETSSKIENQEFEENVTIGGVLGTMYDRIGKYMLESGNQYYVNGYNPHNLDLWNAEPEFSGKYIMICSMMGGEYLKLAEPVVEAALNAQRNDGYLGCLPRGNELVNFSIWNETFTLLGLIEYYKATKDQKALEGAIRCADYTMELLNSLVNRGGKITDSLNGGSQHISAIIAYVRLYQVTGDYKYLYFADFMILRSEEEGLYLIQFDDILRLRSTKGIEMMVVYLGISEYANVLKNIDENEFSSSYSCDELIDATNRYWMQIENSQIRNTGSGTTGEHWRKNGNVPANLPTRENVNENCVTVGWCELTIAQFYEFEDIQCLDALEKSIYNALLGSCATDGSDFAYYQGNYGRKEFATSGGMYKCCRTRGMSMFASLPYMLYKYDGKTIYPNIYTESTYQSKDGLNVACETNYPQDGNIIYHINNQSNENKIMKLRVPAWCDNFTLEIDGKAIDGDKNDFIEVEITPGKHQINFNLEMNLKIESYLIKNKTHYDFNYGPLLLVHDRHNGTLLKEVSYSPDDGIPTKIDNQVWNNWDENSDGSWYLAHFQCNNLNLVDYASAGRANPKMDLFQTYIIGRKDK